LATHNGDLEKLQAYFLYLQRRELTQHHIYRLLAARGNNEHVSVVLQQLAHDERRHHDQWQHLTQTTVQPIRLKIGLYCVLARILGMTFALKLIERSKFSISQTYRTLQQQIPQAPALAAEEDAHQRELDRLLADEHLIYTGSIVLGLNDALVELTGALTGLTFALQNTPLIAMSGIVTGSAAALSMAASVYLSTKSEETSKRPLKAAAYTGTAYISTVLLLIMPYLLLSNYILCLIMTMSIALLIIGGISYYLSVTQGGRFRRRALEMAMLSLGIAAISFGIGSVLRQLFAVNIEL